MQKMSGFRLYWRYIALHAKSGVQYKGWFLMVINVLLAVISDPISTIFLFQRFGQIGRWSMEMILLVYAIAVTCFGLAETLCRGFDYFPFYMLRDGSFDRVLLRPRSVYLQVMASYFHLHRIARAASGLFAIFWCLHRLGIPLTPDRILLLLVTLAGGFILYCGVLILTSGISFYTIRALEWVYLFTNAGYSVTRCPPEYLPAALRTVFTFLLPLLVISYYPASLLCGWGEPAWTGLLALPVGVAFLLLSCLVWQRGMRRYSSAGS